MKRISIGAFVAYVVLAGVVAASLLGWGSHLLAKEFNPCWDGALRSVNAVSAFEQCFISQRYVVVEGGAKGDDYVHLMRLPELFWEEVTYEAWQVGDGYYSYYAEYANPWSEDEALQSLLDFIEYVTPKESSEIYFWIVTVPPNTPLPDIAGWSVDYRSYSWTDNDGNVRYAHTLSLVK